MGTFAYRNQGTAFLILVLLISGLLYFLYEKRASEKLKQGGPHLLLYSIIFLLCCSLWLALSRGGIIFGFALALLFSFVAFLISYKNRKSNQFWFISIVSLIILVSLGTLFYQLSDFERIKHRIARSYVSISNIESYDRTLSTKATWDMAKDRINFGWGAGSFSYVFPIYQKDCDILWYDYYKEDRGWIGRKVYKYAHNDWVQFLARLWNSRMFISFYYVCCATY